MHDGTEFAYAVQAALLCGSTYTTTENGRKPQIYREDREGTVLIAIKTKTFGYLPQDMFRFQTLFANFVGGLIKSSLSLIKSVAS